MPPPRRLHELAPDRDPWERQPGETEKAYGQFRMYLEQGPTRTLAQTAEFLTLNKSHTRQISAAKRWVERAQAWDRENDRQFMARMATERRKLVENEATIARGFLAKIIPRINRLSSEDMDNVGPLELGRLTEMVMRLMRDAYGVPDKTTTAATVARDIDTPDDSSEADLTDEAKLAQLREWNREIADFLDAAEAQREDTTP